jgi:hypothetical protein
MDLVGDRGLADSVLTEEDWSTLTNRLVAVSVVQGALPTDDELALFIKVLVTTIRKPVRAA